MNKIIPLTIVLFFFALSLSACNVSAQAATEPSTAVPAAADPSAIIAEGRVEPIRYAEIAFNASGVVSEVLVKEGEAVKKGQLMIQLGGESDQIYAAAQLELVNAQQALKDLQNSSGTGRAQVVIDLKDAKEEYEDAVDYLDYLQDSKKIPQTESRRFLIQTRKGYEYRIKTKHFKGPAPEDWIIEAENDLALKRAKWEDLQRTYERMKGGMDLDQLAVLEARLRAAQAGIAALEVTAPFDGVVAKMNAKAGNSINAGQVAVTVADFSEWMVKTTDLTEIDVVNVNEGQPVEVFLDALPDISLKGSVLSIGQSFSENQGDIVYEVTILLTNQNPAMRWGMTTEAKFINDD